MLESILLGAILGVSMGVNILLIKVLQQIYTKLNSRND